jgi:tetratricopeptide (TPR) repeat protein
MFSDTQVFQTLEAAIPAEVRTSIVRRIRRVPALWSALHDEGFLKKAVSFAVNDPDRWRPGLMGLLFAAETDYLRSRFSKGVAFALKVSDESLARGEAALQSLDPATEPSLDKASLAALALAKQSELDSNSIAAPSSPGLIWSCLYSISPDSRKVVDRLAESLPASAETLLHTLLDNESPDRAAEICQSLLPSLDLPSVSALCESAAAMGEPALAQRLLAAVPAQFAGDVDSARSPQKRLLRARMLRLAGEPSSALPEADAARKEARTLLLDTLIESAQAAEAEKNFTTALSFWQEAGAFSPAAGGIRAGIARSLSGLGRDEEALAALPASAEDPEDLLLLARIQVKTGAKEKALDLARQASMKASTVSDPRLNVQIAGILADCDDSRGAAQMLAQVTRAWPHHPEAFSRLAELQALTGDWRAAEETASSAWHLDPEDNRSLRLLAQSAERGNRPKEAAEYYRRLSGRLSDDPALFLSLAQTSLAAGDRAQSRQAVERALVLQPECGEACAILGLIDLAEGKDDTAFASLQKATRLAPASVAPWKALAELHAAKGNREAAATTLRAGAESASDPAVLLLALGRILIDEGRLREAASSLERALQLHSEDTSVLTALAETCSGLGQAVEAEQYLDRALAISPALLPAAKSLTSLLKSARRFAEARSMLERAIAADPQSPALLIELGSLLIDMHRHSTEADLSVAGAALSALQQAAAMSGSANDSRLPSLTGWAQIFTGHLPEAIAIFGSLLQSIDGLTLEQKVDAHKGLAEALLRSGDYPTSVHNLQSAMQLAPADTALQRRLAESFAASGLHEDALEIYRKILADSPDSLPALSGLAASLLALHRTDEAVSALCQASEMDPSNPEPAIRLAEIHLQGGDGNRARAELARCLKLADPHDAGIALRAGRLLVSLKEFAEAGSVFEKALEQNPSSVRLLVELGQTLRNSGKNAQAFGIFRRASDLERNNSEHPANAADALWADGRKSAAIAFLRKAVQLDPLQPVLLRRLASGLNAVGLTRDSLPYYDQAMKLAPADLNLGLEAAQAAFRAGDLEKADAWKETGAGENSSADGKVLKARIAIRKGDLKKAVSVCDQIVDAYPADARGWALLAQALASGTSEKAFEGRLVSAETALRKAAELCADSPESLGFTGQAALVLKDYPTAVRCLESLCRCAPDDPDAHTALAKAAILKAESSYRRQLADAELQPSPVASIVTSDAVRSALARAAALGASEETIQPLFERAALAFTQPDPKSIESLEALNQDNPSPEIALAIAQAWLRADDAPKAAKAAESAVSLEPDMEEARTLLGICEWKTGRSESALASFRQATRSDPRSPLPHAWAAKLLSETDRREDAIAELRDALQLSPDVAAWQYSLGTWNEDAGNRSAALPCLQRATELDPSNGEYHLRFAHALARDGDPLNALAHFRKAASLLPTPPAGLYAEIGKAAVEINQPAEAYEAFQLAIEKSDGPAPFAWTLGKARAAIALGRRDEARMLAKNVLNGEGHPPEARLILAEVDESEGRLYEAIRHLDHAASEMDDPILPALRLARLWTATGSAARSSAAMQALLEAHPENDEAHHLLAEALMESGRMEDALRAGQKSSDLAPRNTAHWILLGRISRKMGQLDQSLAALAKAREIAPQDGRTAVEYGLTYEAQNRWDLALDAYRSALKFAPENAELHYRMGVVHKNMRAYSDAASELRRAVQIEPQNLAAHKLLSGVMALSLVYGMPTQSADTR